MRRCLLILPFVFACAKGEEMPADSAAMAAAPSALTEADVAGTWTGTSMMDGTDSVFAHWTAVCASGTCLSTSTEAPKDTVPSTYTIAGDSAAASSAAYAEPALKGAMVVDHWVARLTGSTLAGHGWVTMADKPDSVALRYRFTGTKTP